MLLQVSNMGGPMLLQVRTSRTNVIAGFEHPGAVGTNVIAVFELPGAVGINVIAGFEHPGAVRTNVIALFEHPVGTRCEESPTVNGTRWCKRTNSISQCYGILKVGGCSSIC